MSFEIENGVLIKYTGTESHVVIPENVISIDDFAFEGCIEMTSIKFGEGIASIGENAFCGCANLMSVIIPKSVTDIGCSAFYGCDGIISIEVEEGNPVYHSKNNCVIETNTNCLVVGYKNSIIPDYVTSIGGFAFFNCNSNIEIPLNVRSIDWHAFSCCTELTNIVIPEGVTSIGMSAFRDCTGLTSIVIPKSIINIADHAFSGCSRLMSIEVVDGNKVYHSNGNCIIKTDTNCLMLGCKNSVIPDYVTSIDDLAFLGCDELASIVVPKSVTSIGFALSNCPGLMSIAVENENAVYHSKGNCIIETKTNCLVVGCKNSIIPNYITHIGSFAFSGCTDLTSIVIPDTVVRIEVWAFEGCSNLTIKGCRGSCAEWYAIENHIAFEPID